MRLLVSNTIISSSFRDVMEVGQFGCHGIDFRSPNADHLDRYVAIFWPDDGRWYLAKITKAHGVNGASGPNHIGGAAHHVNYLDGTGQWINFAQERFVEIPPDMIFERVGESTTEAEARVAVEEELSGPPQLVLFRALTSTGTKSEASSSKVEY